MKAHKIADEVYCLYADIAPSESLFEGIWPIPWGVSLNAYLVKGKKTALIDLFRDWSDAPKRFEEALVPAGCGFADIDYLILNHLEPDHTGWLDEFRRLNPKAEIISTAKGINLVKSFYPAAEAGVDAAGGAVAGAGGTADEGVAAAGGAAECGTSGASELRLRAVKDGDTLDLGGVELVFYETPNIHWPETMMTWEPKSGTLFSCDAFGSFGALECKVFDDEFSEAEHALFEQESLRYYANIVSSFSSFVEKGIEKLKNLAIRCVAPSHGMVWRKNPRAIIERYAKYASYSRVSGAGGGAFASGEKEIAVIWGSMYGNTKLGLDAVIRGIEAEGVPYTICRVPDEDVSYALAAAFKARALVLAMPTYEYAMFPPMAYVLDMFRRKHIFGKTVLRVGSWGWVGGAKKEYEAAIESLKWESLPSVEWAGSPKAGDLAALEAGGRELARKVKAATDGGPRN